MNRTVSTLSPIELDVYRKALKARRLTADSRAEARIKKAREVARRAATMLKDEFEVNKVVVFGSLIHPRLFHARSDIDLAVWGLTGREYYRAVGILQSLDIGIGIDLIAFEDAPQSIQEIIRREGKEL